MRQYNPHNPFNLDQPEVRFPRLAAEPNGWLDPTPLIDSLDELGVEVESAAHWRELTAAATSPAPLPPTPDLDGTAADVRAYMDAYAIREAAPPILARDRVLQALNRAMCARIADQADAIITQLRAPFDAAAAVMLTAKNAGIAEDDDDATMRHAGPDLLEAWQALPEAAATLDKILGVRQQLSLWIGVQPSIDKMPPLIATSYRDGTYPSSIDWSVVTARPGSGASLTKRDQSRPWARWLTIAEQLCLPTVAELSPEEVLRSYGYDLDTLQLAAQRRLDDLDPDDQDAA